MQRTKRAREMLQPPELESLPARDVDDTIGVIEDQLQKLSNICSFPYLEGRKANPHAALARTVVDVNMPGERIGGASFEGPEPFEGQQKSWAEARAKAAISAANLSSEELLGLLRGSHFNTSSITADVGYYIGNTLAIPRLGVPALKLQDAGQGFRTTEPGTDSTTTAWPCMLALASTWDEDLVKLVARAIADEFKGKGANVLLGPSINVHRVAAGGRNFEYLSGEDPYLGSRLTRAYVEGAQGQGVMAVVKHFAFNEQETNRNSMDAEVGERAKWELYYPPFKAAVDAGVGSFMCSYNRVNGTFACGNPELLLQDLKKTLGFQGFVMSDWLAAHNASDLEHGLDQEQPGLLKVSKGPGSNETLDWTVLTDAALKSLGADTAKEAATRILTAVYRLGLDQGPSCVPPRCQQELLSNQTEDTTLGRRHADIALSATSAAVTLLKNSKGLLPLTSSKIKTLAVLGWAAYDTSSQFLVGGGSGFVSPGNFVTPIQAIRERASRAGVTVLSPSSGNLSEALALADQAD
ncbi:unnamed protein product, partial [Polarella glacialis]